MTTRQEEADFGGVLALALDQAGARETDIQEISQDGQGTRVACTKRLTARLLSLVERFPFRDAPGGEVIDRNKPGTVRTVRRRMLDATEAEFDRMERELLTPNLRAP